jgi:hypothetical protein
MRAPAGLLEALRRAVGTKMARICVGDRVEAKLMGYSQPVLEHVATVTRGIGVSDAEAGAQGLPNVDPVYTWVALAQRVPVRIAIDSVPPGIPLVSRRTARLTIKDGVSTDGRTWLGRIISAVETRLLDVMSGPPARPGCVPATTTERATTESLPVDTEKTAPTPEVDRGAECGDVFLRRFRQRECDGMKSQTKRRPRARRRLARRGN